MSPARVLAYNVPQLALILAGAVFAICGDWEAAAVLWASYSWVLGRECKEWERIAKGRKR